MKSIDTPEQALMVFFEALADVDRLKIAGLLACGDESIEDLIEKSGLSAKDVIHHLRILNRNGFITLPGESSDSVCSIKSERFITLKKKAMDKPSVQPAVELPEFLSETDRKILATHLDADGRLKTIPLGRKKLMPILRWLVTKFDPDKRYTEKEVNEIIKQYNSDTSGLRRDLIDTGLMARETGGRAYWVTKQS
jgi:hypothetical protein